MRPSKTVNEGHEDAAGALKRVRLAALRALTRREYGEHELQRKLEQRGFPAELVTQALSALRGQGLLDDNRYADSAVRHHVLRGHGPIRIRAELRAHGLQSEAVELAIGGANVDWMQLACEVRRKRFGSALPKTAAERAKQGRFLQYRGFDSAQIRAAFRPGADSAANEFPDLSDEDGSPPDIDE